MTEQQAETISEEEEIFLEEMSFFESSRDKIEFIVELGKNLPEMDERHKTEANRVRGCQSQVWVISSYDQQTNRVSFEGDSDAIIVKGLVSIVLRLFSNRPPQDIASNDLSVFEKAGLGNMLTPGRANGLYSMLSRIKAMAKVYGEVRSREIG